MRRPSVTVQSGSVEPPLKRRKKASRLDVSDTVDSVVDESVVAKLKEECLKKKRDRCMGTIQELTTNTFSCRRKWIKEEQPRVCEVIDMYPSLKFRKIVS